MVAICPEARAVTWGKPVDEAVEWGFGWVGNSTWSVRKGIEFIGKVDEAWVTNLVFGSDKSRGEFGKIAFCCCSY